VDAAILDALLRATLADGKLAGAERDGLLAYSQRTLKTPADYGTARKCVFAVATQAVSNTDPAEVLAWVEAVLKALDGSGASGGPAEEPSTAHFSPGSDCLARITSRLSGARQSADICVFTITDNRVSDAVLDAHRRGVRVRVITDNDKANDLGSDISRLAQAGVPVKVDRTPYHMHHKFALIDGRRLLNGSYNWTRGAAEQNEENLTDTADAALLAAFQRHFDELWAKL
jgi:cardiolipin hydrolase